MVTGGKPLVMHCSVSKLLDSGVSIFRMLPRISYSGLGTDTVRKKLAFYLLPLMNDCFDLNQEEREEQGGEKRGKGEKEGKR